MTPNARDLTRSIIEQLIQFLPAILDDPAPGGREIRIAINAERSLARLETTQTIIVRRQPAQQSAE